MPEVTLRPNRTLYATNGTVVGAATVDAALADDSDASYVHTADFHMRWGVGFTGVSLPVGARIRRVRPWVRASGDAVKWYGWVRLDVAGVSTPEERVPAGSSPTWWGFAERAAQPAGGVWTEAAVNAVSLHAYAPAHNAVTPWRAQEASLGVLYALPPTVTGVVLDEWSGSPDYEVTTTSRPTARWDFTPGDDGGLAVRAEVKVFTLAATLLPGFNPETTVAEFAGTVLGSGSSVVLDPLPNGDYLLYVRAAQDVNGLHWSAWVNAPFTMLLDLPDPPTILTTVDDTRAWVRLDVTATDPADRFDVIRSTDGGVTWTPIRTTEADGALIPVGGAAFTFDAETGNGQPVVYAARSVMFVDGYPIVGDWSTSTSPVAWSSTSWWVKHPHRPRLNVPVTVRSQATTRKPIRQTTYQPVGRRDPVIVSDVRSLTIGELVLRTVDPTERALLDALLDAGGTLLVHAPPTHDFRDRYIVVGDTARSRVIDHNVGTAMWDSFTWREVTVPPGVIDGFGATYAELDTAFSTYDQQSGFFASYDEMRTWVP